MGKLIQWIDNVIKIVLIVFTILMCFIVLWQVISRFMLNNPSRWSEEVARYFMIWITFLGASVGVKTGSHLGLTIFISKLKDIRSQMIMTILAYVCIIIFSSILVIYGWEYMIEGKRQTAMSFNVKMSVVYACIPLSGSLMIMNSIQQISYIIMKWKKGETPFSNSNTISVDI